MLEAPCCTPEAQALMSRPAKTLRHCCGYQLLSKIERCWGPSIANRGALEIAHVAVAYWDVATRKQVFVCPGCGVELPAWWEYPGSSNGKP